MIRKKQGFRPGTRANHICMMKKYVSFCLRNKLKYIKPSVETVCVYIEFLARQFISYKSVVNYLSAVKLLHDYAGSKARALDSFDVALMRRAVRLSLRTTPNRRPPITIPMLKQLCGLCDKYGRTGTVIKLAMQIGFFAYLRGSNLFPTTSKAFDKSRHLTREDVKVCSGGLLISLKWSKTRQSAGQPALLPIPTVSDKSIDALHTFQLLQKQIRAKPSSPLFLLPSRKTLTLTQFRTLFKILLSKAGYENRGYTVHSLRAGGSSVSFMHRAKELDIQKHGTWTSSCYKNYISLVDPFKSTVCKALKAAALCS